MPNVPFWGSANRGDSTNVTQDTGRNSRPPTPQWTGRYSFLAETNRLYFIRPIIVPTFIKIQPSFTPYFSLFFIEKGLGKAAWGVICDDGPLMDFILKRNEANDTKRVPPPDFHRTVTPAIVYLLDRTTKNNVPIHGVIRTLEKYKDAVSAYLSPS